MNTGEKIFYSAVLVVDLLAVRAAVGAILEGLKRGWGRPLPNGRMDLNRHDRPVLFWTCLVLVVCGTVGTAAGMLVIALGIAGRINL